MLFQELECLKEVLKPLGGEAYSHFDAEQLIDYIVSGDFSALDNAISNPEVTDIPWYYADVIKDLKAYDFSKCDILICNWATNDYSIGTSLTAYENAFKSFAQKLLTAFPNITLIKCTPTQRFYTPAQIDIQGTIVSKPTIERIDSYYSGSVVAWRGENNPTLDEYAKADKTICELLNIKNIDLLNIGINYYTRTQNFSGSDMTHQNANGRKLLAENILNNI